ncbi:MAG: hypothetical protein EON92_05850 [Burkholderiales bacterium]|nr:MAG: hypothetical protein EON92_05850 [Burkholderiales bacterium]
MSDSTRVRDHLQALPEVELPNALWQRVSAGRRHKIQRRRLFVGAASLALAMIAVTGILAPLQEVGRPEAASIALPSAHLVDEKRAELRAIDQALQAAYDRGASDAEIAPMWAARHALLAQTRTKSKANQT